MAAVHLYYGEIAERCPGCKAPEVRAAWGCDEPAPFPTFSITCPTCEGEGCADQTEKRERREPFCEEGQLVFWRCASSVASREACALVSSHVDMERGILPASGGRRDQARLWSWWMSRVGIERGRIAERRRAEEFAARDRASRVNADG